MKVYGDLSFKGINLKLFLEGEKSICNLQLENFACFQASFCKFASSKLPKLKQAQIYVDFENVHRELNFEVNSFTCSKMKLTNFKRCEPQINFSLLKNFEVTSFTIEISTHFLGRGEGPKKIPPCPSHGVQKPHLSHL